MELEAGHVVEISGIVTILKGDRALRTTIGTALGILTFPLKNGIWRCRLMDGRMAMIHSTAVTRIRAKVEIRQHEIPGPDGAAFPVQFLAVPEETWRD